MFTEDHDHEHVSRLIAESQKLDRTAGWCIESSFFLGSTCRVAPVTHTDDNTKSKLTEKPAVCA